MITANLSKTNSETGEVIELTERKVDYNELAEITIKGTEMELLPALTDSLADSKRFYIKTTTSKEVIILIEMKHSNLDQAVTFPLPEGFDKIEGEGESGTLRDKLLSVDF